MSDSEKPKTFLRECIEKIGSSWQKRRKTIRRSWQVPFVLLEWICEEVSNLLKRWAFLDILGHVGRLTILVGVIFYIKGCPERRMQSENLQMQVENLRQQLANQQKTKHYQAWQVINLAQGKPGSGGRMDALQDLNKDKISLSGVDVSQAYLPTVDLEGAYLPKANLSGSNLFASNLSHAVLQEADLSGADVSEANLSGAKLSEVNLSGANLSHTNLFEAGLFDANLFDADVHDANLARAKLVRTNLSHANLFRANLNDANVSDANLSRAKLWNSNLRSIKNWLDIKSIELANIYGVENPPNGFIEWAKEHGAVIMEDDEEWKKLICEKRQEQTKEK